MSGWQFMFPANPKTNSAKGGVSACLCRFSVILHFTFMSAATLTVFSSTGCRWGASGKNALGTQLHQQGQYTAALEQFQQVVSDDPTNPDGYYNLAATTHRLAKQRNDQHLFANAEALYNQCLDHSPNHIECHRRQKLTVG